MWVLATEAVVRGATRPREVVAGPGPQDGQHSETAGEGAVMHTVTLGRTDLEVNDHHRTVARPGADPLMSAQKTMQELTRPDLARQDRPLESCHDGLYSVLSRNLVPHDGEEVSKK